MSESEFSSKSDIADWNRIADTYALRQESGPPFPYIAEILLRLLGDVTGLRVLDLGCGQGWLAGKLHTSGAQVTGIDGSSELLGRAKTQFRRIEFVEFDLAEGLPNFGGKFDIVVSHTVLMDIPNVQPLFTHISSALSDGGRFLFTLLHPCFWNQKSHQDDVTGEWHKRVKGYLAHEVWRVDGFGGHSHYHRPICYYAEALHQADMVIRQIIEPEHEPSGSSAIPEDFIRRFPLFLVIEAVPFRK